MFIRRAWVVIGCRVVVWRHRSGIIVSMGHWGSKCVNVGAIWSSGGSWGSEFDLDGVKLNRRRVVRVIVFIIIFIFPIVVVIIVRGSCRVPCGGVWRPWWQGLIVAVTVLPWWSSGNVVIDMMWFWCWL